MSSLPACMVAALLGWSAATQAALGQGMSDPTRPPSMTSAPEGQSEAPSTVLQSVLISPGRKLAVINGSVVPLGGRVGEATVAAISDGEVVLKYPDRTETLKLLGGVERKPVRRSGK